MCLFTGIMHKLLIYVKIWESRTGKVLYHWCSGMLSPALTPTEMSNEPPTFLPPQRYVLL